MTIGKINNINKIYNSNSVNKNKGVNSKEIKDNINISDDALKKAELAKYRQIIKNTPDIRQDKVESAKLNLKSYMENNQTLETLIDKISDIVTK